MNIKRYFDFINEKMGVPVGIVESAEKLYELITSKFEEFGHEELDDDDEVCNLQIDLPIKIQISDMVFDKVNFYITIHIDDRFKNVDVASWGVMINPTSIENYKFLHDKSSINHLNLMVNFISHRNNKFMDIVKYLRKDRIRTIGVISHELKHIYDKYVVGYELFPDIIDYGTWSKARTGINEIDNFFYLLYVISKAESLVRPSEIAGYIHSSGITKSEFKKFLEETPLYKELIEIKHWSYDKLKEQLMNNIEKIRDMFEEIPDGETDSDVVGVVLNSAYSAVLDKTVEGAKGLIKLNNPLKLLTGEIEQSDIEFFNKFISTRVFKNVDDFFEFWQRKLNFEGDKVLKKISKLYDMCKDDNVNPLMTKINDRHSGQCIVNPKLYNEFVLGVSDSVIKYPKG